MFTLVVLIYAGFLAKGDSVAIQTVPGWTTQESCLAAGAAMKPLVKGTAKEISFVCIKKD